MRPVLAGDVTAAARALLGVPAHAREAMARRLVTKADAADRYRRKLGKTHPFWGNGTLMSAALGSGKLAPERRLDEPEYADCFVMILDALCMFKRPAR